MANKHDRMPKPTYEQKNRTLSHGLHITVFVRILEGHSVRSIDITSSFN